MSWTKKLLRVNLTDGSVNEEALNMEWAAQYIGQRGLATRYLVEETDPKVDPLGPDNRLIFATGPLTGTAASTAGRYSVITKSPLTGAVACSNSGGFFGAELKAAGWDMIIFEGKSPSPVMLNIVNDKAELAAADDLWGKSVWEVDKAIHDKTGDPQTRIAAVGRSAETGCLYSAVINDLHRAAGRSGVGTVMASKNVKAIAVRGTRGVGNIKDPARFMQSVADEKKVLAENAVTGQGLPALGTQVLMNVINEIGALPPTICGKPSLRAPIASPAKPCWSPARATENRTLPPMAPALAAPSPAGVFQPLTRRILRYRINLNIRVIPVAWSTRLPGHWGRTPVSMTWTP